MKPEPSTVTGVINGQWYTRAIGNGGNSVSNGNFLMKSKYDERRPDRLPSSAPSATAEPLARKPIETKDLSTDVPKSDSSAGNGGSRRRRTKEATDMPSKDTNADLQERYNAIGAGLKRIFNEIVEEPIPPEFLELLDKIDLKREQ
ncbi:MAG: NepR family anti-sigma factor [Alphaproteobacteria bacterium]|nr:NepR family anti-sigma factor [Alphaproteobacteria bacterium]